LVIIFGSPEALETDKKNNASALGLIAHELMVNERGNYWVNEIQNKFVYQIWKIIYLFCGEKNVDNYMVNFELLRLQECFYEDGLDFFNMLLKEISYGNVGDRL
jgi:hypothetical protein